MTHKEQEEPGNKPVSDYYPVKINFPPVVLTPWVKSVIDKIHADCIVFEIANALLTAPVDLERSLWHFTRTGGVYSKGLLTVECEDEFVDLERHFNINGIELEEGKKLHFAVLYKALPDGDYGYVISFPEEGEVENSIDLLPVNNKVGS
jgi:hypothetical protein